MFRQVAMKSFLVRRAITGGVGKGIMMMSSVVPAPAATTPSVKDLLIDLTFVDPSGARRKIKGVIGKCSFRDMFCECWHEITIHVTAPRFRNN